MGRIRKILVLLVSILTITIRLGGQPNVLPVFKQITHPFMPSITSDYFFFSEDGLMWFSTAQGLTSFDGSDIIYYSSLDQTNGLGLSRIGAMAEDDDHNFYIATGSGLHYYNRRTRIFTSLVYNFRDKSNAPIIYFSSLYLDNNKHLYAGSIAQGLFIYNTNTKKLDHFNIDPIKPDSWENRGLNSITCFAQHATDNNKLWVGTYHSIYLFDKLTKKFSKNFEVVNPAHYDFLPPPSILISYDIEKMDVADDSTLWFNCYTEGFGKYNTNTGKVKLFLYDARLKTPERNIGYIIPKFAKLSPGRYLLGIYDDRTAIFETRTETVTYFNVTNNNFPEEATRFVTTDRQGTVWLLQRGFIYAAIPDHLRLKTVIVSNKTGVDFQLPKIRGLYFDTADHLFYCTFLHSSGVHVYDSNFYLVNIIPTAILNNYYTYNATIDNSITIDGSRRLWTVGWENYIMKPGENKFDPVSKNFPSLKWLNVKNEFNDIKTTRNGNILIRKNNGNIYYVDHATLVTDTFVPPTIKANEAQIKNATDWYDKKNNLFYFNLGMGIAQFNLSNKQMRILPLSSLYGNIKPSQNICVSALDANGRIWFVIPKYGVRVLDPETLLCIDSIQYGTKGLMQGGYTAILGGSDHCMLFRSANGIVLYDYKRNFSFLFDRFNGLSTPENKSFLSSNGYLIVGQSSRFEYFKLSDFANYSSTVMQHLNTIFADTVNVFTRNGIDDAETIRIPHHQNTLSFSFSTTEFFFPERIEYAYQLTPLEKDWNYTNYFNRKISYTKLPPGNYVFRLKSQMQGSNWDISPVEYTIIIVPAWWQTNWFKVLCVVVVVVILIYFIQKRIRFIRITERQKIKHEKELMELEAKALRAQMNPHFIFNSLNSIKSLINKNENDKAANYLTTFSKLIRTLFQNSDKREVSLYEELETCKLYTQLEKMRFSDKVDFIFDIDGSIDLKDFKVPALIVQPFIENAIWHGLMPKETGGNVTVSVRRNNGAIQCIIDDNGIGREQSEKIKPLYEATYQSKGIGLTQSRLELDKLLNERDDSISIIDKKNELDEAKGTKVIISFKENRN